MSVLLNYLAQSDLGLDASIVSSLEPVSLAQALSQMRIESDASDSAFIGSVIIPAARQLAEKKSGSAIRPARYRQTLSSFPARGKDYVSGALSFAPFSRSGASLPIKLAHGLVRSVESVSYIDASGATQQIDPTTLNLVATSDANVELALSAGAYWPQAASVANAVTIVYRAGVTPDELSMKFPSVISWILLACAWAYENREMFLVGKGAADEMPAGYADTLLGPITVPTRF